MAGHCRFRALDYTKREILLVSFRKHASGTYISIALKHVDLDRTPVYSALPYTWGEKPSGDTVLMNYQYSAQTCGLRVTRNLYEFLVQKADASTASV